MVEYCNLTTDLQNVCSNIEDFAGFEVIEDFTASENNYLKNGTGSTSIVREDDIKLTEASDTNLAVGEFYYDSDNDILYIRCTDDADPSTHTIEVNSSDWLAIKTWSRKIASGQIESMLDSQFPRPIPVSALNFDYTGNHYDPDIVKSVATMTCVNIIERNEPENPLIDIYKNRIWNPEENSGVMWDYYKGRRAFSFQTTTDEYYGNVIPVSESTSGRIKIRGNKRSSDNYIYRVKITTAGAVETAKFDFSDDNGRTWILEDILTYEQYQYLTDGLYIAFEGTFAEDDEWKIKTASADEPNKASIGSITLERN